MNVDLECDASGLACPMPVVKARKALNGLKAGQVLRVISTDAGSLADMPTLVEAGGHQMLSTADEGGRYVFVIRKG